jgi:hypothetical protein
MATNSKFFDRLKAMQGAYENAEAGFMGSLIPEDTYMARFIKAELKMTPSEVMLIERTHLVTEGQYDGETVKDALFLKNEGNMGFFKRWVELMGFTAPTDLASELEPLLEDMNAQPRDERIKVSHWAGQNGRTNINVEVLEIWEPGADTAEAGTTAGDSDAEAGEPAAAGSEDDPDLKARLLTFCAAQNVEADTDDKDADGNPVTQPITDDFGNDAIIAAMANYDYPKEQLTDDEISVLEEVGLSTNIKAPAKPKPPAPRTAPKPAAPASAPKPTASAKPAGKPAPAPAKPAGKVTPKRK